MPTDRDRIPEEIQDAAQDWLLRLSAPDTSAEDRRGFAAWRDANARHRMAFDEVAAVWSAAEDLEHAFAPHGQAGAQARRPGPQSAAANPLAALSRPRRRWGVAVAGAIAACLLIFIGGPVFMHLPARLLADHSTAVGEQRSVILPDGSIAYLNTDTAIDVAFSGERRLVTLRYGEALFEVRKDAARPFDVVALDGRSTAVGTAYAVATAGDRARVTVTEGVVSVTSPAGTADAAAGVLAVAGQQVDYRRGGRPGPVATVDAEQATAWRRGIIVIRDRPLEEALAEIGRYQPGRIVLLGDPARYGRVTARLSLADLAGGIDALAATHGLQVARVTDYLLILR